MDCRGIFWQLSTTRTSEPREPNSSVFCVVKSPAFLLEEDATLKRALTWDAFVAGGGGGVKFRCTKVFKATEKWFSMDGGGLQDSNCFDSHGLGGENNQINTWIFSQPNHVWVRGTLCVRREVLRCHPKLRRSPVIPSPTAGESVLSVRHKNPCSGKKTRQKFQFHPFDSQVVYKLNIAESCWGKLLALFIS